MLLFLMISNVYSGASACNSFLLKAAAGEAKKSNLW